MRYTHQLLIGLILLVAVFGCTNQSSQTQPFPQSGDDRPPGSGGDNPSRSGFRNQGFMNMTEEQRQNFMKERTQAMLDACKGRAENESCFISTPNGEMNGTCILQLDGLLCRINNNLRNQQWQSR